MTRSKKNKGKGKGKGKGNGNGNDKGKGQDVTQKTGDMTYKASNWKKIEKRSDTRTFKRDDPALLKIFHPLPHEIAVDLVFKDGKAIDIATAIPPLSEFLTQKRGSEPEKWDTFMTAVFSGLSSTQLATAISPPFMDRSLLQLDHDYLLSIIVGVWGSDVTRETLFEPPDHFATRLLAKEFPDDSVTVELGMMYIDYFNRYGCRPPAYVLLPEDSLKE